MRNKCCDKERPHLVSSGSYVTVNGSHGRHSVYICESCGRFDVRISENGVYLSTTFHLWSDKSLDAAVIPYNRAADEDEEPHYGKLVPPRTSTETAEVKTDRTLVDAHETKSFHGNVHGLDKRDTPVIGAETQDGNEMNKEKLTEQARDYLHALRVDDLGYSQLMADFASSLLETELADLKAALKHCYFHARRKRVIVYRYPEGGEPEQIGPKSDDPDWDRIIQACEAVGLEPLRVHAAGHPEPYTGEQI